jgi:hypothetical protein
MNINNAFPSKWIKSGDIPEDADLILTIASVSVEEVGSEENQESKPVVYFKENEKGLVLNKTNAETIANLYTPETENWQGKRIALFATEVSYGGKQTLGIRIRLKPPKAPVGVSGDPTEGLYANTSTLAPETVQKWTGLVKKAIAAKVVMNFSLDETDDAEQLAARVAVVKQAIADAESF